MKIAKALVVLKLARSGAEAVRLVKDGAVSVGGCDSACSFFTTGKCTCGGWVKVKNPLAEVLSKEVIKVGNGFWRLLSRVGVVGYDQVNGVATVP